MSRGLDKATAERLVVRGFLGSVIVEIPVKEVRDEMIATIRRKNCQNAKGQPMLDVEVIRKDFPILDQIVNDEPLVYLDNAATTQKTTSSSGND